MKTVTFKAKDKPGVKSIPGNANQISMAGGKDATNRNEDELAGTPIRDPAAVDEQFPTASFVESHPGDALMAAKLDLAEQNQKDGKAPGATPMGMLVAKDSDFQRLIEIRERELGAQFEQWFATNFDRADVTHKAAAREMFGKFYEDRLRNLDTNLETTRKLARLKITGPKTKEDLELLYAVEAGFVDTDYLDNILHPEKAQQSQSTFARQSNFRRGIFNPNRFARGDPGVTRRPKNAMRATGKNSIIGTSTFGTGNTPFSAMGMGLDQETERNTNFAKTLAQLNE